MKILFCGGGTVGHISPAIAIAEHAKRKYGISDFAFVGRLGGYENRPILKKGYRLYEIEISGFERKLSLENLKRLFKLSCAMRQAKKIIEEYKPDVVIGTGGYVTWPIIRYAKRKKIPCFIHESNAYPGLVTRMLSKKCDKVFLNLEEAKYHLKKQDNVITVGNPVEERFYKTDRKRARSELGVRGDEILICSYGGSGGAEKMNEVIVDFIKDYSTKKAKLKHIHASGKKYFSKIQESAPELLDEKHGIAIRAYIDNLHTVLNASDIVIARCGAMTISELSACGSVAILIPSPNVTNNHQYKNAKLLSDKSAAIMIEEKNLNKDILISTVDDLIKSPEKRKTLSANIKREFKENSEDIIMVEVLKSAR